MSVLIFASFMLSLVVLLAILKIVISIETNLNKKLNQLRDEVRLLDQDLSTLIRVELIDRDEEEERGNTHEHTT